MYLRAIRCRLLLKSPLGARFYDASRIQRPPPQPDITTCPEPTCACAETPRGLDINHTLRLAGTVPPYKEHVVVSTNHNKWGQRIEDQQNRLAGKLKALLARHGPFHDPSYPILITNSSSPTLHQSNPPVMLFPSFLHVSGVPHGDHGKLCTFVRGYLHGSRTQLQDQLEKSKLLRAKDIALNANKPNTDLSTTVPSSSPPVLRSPRSILHSIKHYATITPIKHITILICAHASRDFRCGILGPILLDQFNSYLQGLIPTSPFEKTILANIQIHFCSHVGGHNLAGNVLIYTPPTIGNEGVRLEGLAGTGIWYGRVEPRHVEGIVRETLLRGRVIEELYRGGVGGWVEATDEEIERK